jgi:hypothetical protein
MLDTSPRGIRSRSCQGAAATRPECNAEGMDTQDEPIEEGHDEASIADKIAGIAEQMRGDAELGHVDRLRAMARQRLEEANLPTDDATVDSVVAAVRPSA